MKTILNDLCIGVFASLWAIIQTFVHLWWILLGRYKYACPIKFDAIHSRILQNVSCKDAISTVFRNLINVPYSPQNNTPYSNNTETFASANINTIPLLKLPSFSETTTDILMLVYIILDGVWIVTSVSLLLASCCKFKEKSSLYFYLPWIITGAIIVGFDIYCSIYFGLNIPENWTLLQWLENLGIIDNRLPKIHSQLKENETKTSSGMGFQAPVFLMTLFASRFFFIWFINVITVFAVYGIAKKVSGEKDIKKRHHHRHNHRRTHSDSSRSSANNTFHNTFEERVRNWQNFYGTLRENSVNELRKKRSSITYLETSSNGTELRCLDISSYNAFKKGRVRIGSENEYRADNETMNSTFKYDVPNETVVRQLASGLDSEPGFPSKSECSLTTTQPTAIMSYEQRVDIIPIPCRMESAKQIEESQLTDPTEEYITRF